MQSTAAALVAVSLASAGLGLERVGRFDEPVYVAGSERTLAVVERYGMVRDVRSGRVLADLRKRVLVKDPRETVDQRGLLSMAFEPGSSRRFYVMYVNRRGRLRVGVLVVERELASIGHAERDLIGGAHLHTREQGARADERATRRVLQPRGDLR